MKRSSPSARLNHTFVHNGEKTAIATRYFGVASSRPLTNLEPPSGVLSVAASATSTAAPSKPTKWTYRSPSDPVKATFGSPQEYPREVVIIGDPECRERLPGSARKRSTVKDNSG